MTKAASWPVRHLPPSQSCVRWCSKGKAIDLSSKLETPPTESLLPPKWKKKNEEDDDK